MAIDVGRGRSSAPIVFLLTRLEAAEDKASEKLIALPGRPAKTLLADKACNRRPLVITCGGTASKAVTPPKSNHEAQPALLLAASMGVWLFYVQHQFEEMTWRDCESWSLHEAALHGSSHYDLPTLLRWITANIGIHHVHHLCSRIPYYRLPQVLRDGPELGPIGRLTLGCVRLALWDERQNRLVSFRDARALR